VRGLGLMLGMELDSAERAKAAVAQMLQRGILINRTNENTLRFLPPYIIQERHIDLLVRALDEVLSSNPPQPVGQPRRAGRSTRKESQK